MTTARQVLAWCHYLEYVAAWQPIPVTERPHWNVIRATDRDGSRVWRAIPLPQTKLHASWRENPHLETETKLLAWLDYDAALRLRNTLDHWRTIPRDRFAELSAGI